MKAVIMAAGVGKRMHGLADGEPKSFLEVGGKSIIAHQITSLKEVGIHNIIIVTGYKRDAFQKFAGGGVVLLYNPFYKSTGVLGSFWFAKGHLNEPFLFMHADTYFEKEILQRVLSQQGNAFAVEFKPCGEEEMKVTVQGDLIRKISKEISQADGEFIGLAKIEDFEAVQRITEVVIEDHHGAFFEKVLQELIHKGLQCQAVNINNLIWEEVDFKEDYFNLLEKLEKNRR